MPTKIIKNRPSSRAAKVRPVRRASKATVDPELVAWTKRFIEQYRSVLETLAKK